MKKWVSMSVAILLLTLSAVAISAASIKLVVNGKEVESDTAPQWIDQQLMVPIQLLADHLNVSVKWNEKKKNLTITNEIPPYEEVASLPNANVKLLARGDFGWYRGFQLKVGNRSREFINWINVGNLTFSPKLYSFDVTESGQEELIVILTTDRGSNFYLSKAHVLEKTISDEENVVKEIYIEDPRTIVMKLVNVQQTKAGVEVKIGDDITVIPKNRNQQTSIEPHLSVDTFVKFSFEDNTLKAQVLIENKPRGYIGSIEILYTYKNGIMQADEVRFNRN